MCKKHLDKHCQRAIEIYSKRKKSNKCAYCGQEAKLPSRQWCEECWFRSVSGRIFGSVDKSDEVRKFFYANPICPYTGFALLAGINASVDHIVPKKRGGKNSLDNVQFVYDGDPRPQSPVICDRPWRINQMKGTMTDEEYKEAIRLQYKHLFGET